MVRHVFGPASLFPVSSFSPPAFPTHFSLSNMGQSHSTPTSVWGFPYWVGIRRSPPPSPPPPRPWSVAWVRDNRGKALLGTLLLGVVVVVGYSAYTKAHRELLKSRQVVRGVDGSKREVIGR